MLLLFKLLVYNTDMHKIFVQLLSPKRGYYRGWVQQYIIFCKILIGLLSVSETSLITGVVTLPVHQVVLTDMYWASDQLRSEICNGAAVWSHSNFLMRCDVSLTCIYVYMKYSGWLIENWSETVENLCTTMEVIQ